MADDLEDDEDDNDDEEEAAAPPPAQQSRKETAMAEERGDERRGERRDDHVSAEGGWLGGLKNLLFLPVAGWLGRTLAGHSAVQRGARKLPGGFRFGLDAALKGLGGVIRIPWPKGNSAARHILNDALDIMTSEAGEALSDGGAVFDKKAAQKASKALDLERARLAERECLVDMDSRPPVIHHPLLVGPGHRREARKGNSPPVRHKLAFALRMGWRYAGEDVCECRKAFEAEEAEAREIEKKIPKRRASAADIYGRHPEAARTLFDRVREVYDGQPLEVVRVYSKARDELDLDNELLAFAKLRGSARVAAAASHDVDVVAGLMALLPDPDPAAVPEVDPAERLRWVAKIEVWLGLLGGSKGNAVAFRDPEKAAELIELISEFYRNDWERPVKLVHKQMDSEDELSALLLARSREEMEQMLLALSEKTLSVRLSGTRQRLEEAVEELREELSEPLGLPAVEAAADAVTSDINRAAEGLRGLSARMRTRSEELRRQRQGGR